MSQRDTQPALGANLPALISDFADLDRSSYLRPDLGDLAFTSLAKSVDELMELMRALREFRVHDAPLRYRVRALSALENVDNHLGYLRNFNIRSQTGDVAANRDALSSQVESAVFAALDECAPLVAYFALRGSAQTLERATSRLESQLTSATQLKDRIESLASDADTILDSMRRSSEATGIQRHAQIFAAQSANHRSRAHDWLVATAVAATLLCVLVGLNLWHALRLAPDVQASTAYTASLTLAKVLAFSVVVSFAIWCARNYRANIHNELVNTHRQNAISTLEAFAQATKDEGTKNAVLVQTTASVFSPQPTGFTSSDSESAGMPKVLELIRPNSAT